MDITITPGILRGRISPIPSKSLAHRYLICAAFADGETEIRCCQVNRDMDATARCLNALGADISRTEAGYRVRPVRDIPKSAVLACDDSGSTLRFLLPVAGALGVDTTFQMTGRLPSRPLSPLQEEMERMGCTLTHPTPDTLRCTGRLLPGQYTLRGDVSSQFITGLLFAAALIPGHTKISVTGNLESRPYVTMTQAAMSRFGVKTDGFSLLGGIPFHCPKSLTVEADWSNAAFFLAAKALGNDVAVENLNPDSCQGDRAIQDLLPRFSGTPVISGADIPDLIPILAVTAAAKHGAEFQNIARLRLKESDRVQSILDMIIALGGRAQAEGDTLTVWGTGLRGGTVDARQDHRIAMSAAIAATVCSAPVRILGAECVNKSYPQFFQEYTRLGGHYEQYLR